MTRRERIKNRRVREQRQEEEEYGLGEEEC